MIHDRGPMLGLKHGEAVLGSSFVNETILERMYLTDESIKGIYSSLKSPSKERPSFAAAGWRCSFNIQLFEWLTVARFKCVMTLLRRPTKLAAVGQGPV